jgi:hypothetical protein
VAPIEEPPPLLEGKLELPKASRLYLVPFGEIKLGTERRDLIKGIIPRVGLTVAWGPQGSQTVTSPTL